MCGLGNESLVHVFRDCDYAPLFRALSSLPNCIIVANSSIRIEDWFDQVRHKATGEEMELFVVSCWRLWNTINKKVHEHVTYDPSDSAFFVQDLVQRFRATRLNLQHCRPPESAVTRSAPPPGWYKVNYDATIFLEPPQAGLGVVVWAMDKLFRGNINKLSLSKILKGLRHVLFGWMFLWIRD